jgi:hypothetical protein
LKGSSPAVNGSEARISGMAVATRAVRGLFMAVLPVV